MTPPEYFVEASDSGFELTLMDKTGVFSVIALTLPFPKELLLCTSSSGPTCRQGNFKRAAAHMQHEVREGFYI